MYFGARYYDARTSVWQSPDPILGRYLPTGDKKRDANLPGMGGVYNSKNLGMYSYGHQNPVRYKDPDGNEIEISGNKKNYGEFFRQIYKATGIKVKLSTKGSK